MLPNFVGSNFHHFVQSGVESRTFPSVMARVAMEGGSRRMSVAETLKQATTALETHRAWMKRRVSTSIAPLDIDAEKDQRTAVVGETNPRQVNVGWALGSEKGVKQRGDNELERVVSPNDRGAACLPAPPPSVGAWQRGGRPASITSLGEEADENGFSDPNSPLAQADSGLLESPNTPFPRHCRDSSPDAGSPEDNYGATASNKFHFTFPSSFQTKQSNGKIKKRKKMGKCTVVPVSESLKEVDGELTSKGRFGDATLLSNQTKSPNMFIGESFHSKHPSVPPVSTMAAWGSLTSLDNYIESLETSNGDIDRKPTCTRNTGLSSFPQLESVAKGVKEEKHDTKLDGVRENTLNSPQLVLVQSSTVQLSGNSKLPLHDKAQNSLTDHAMPSPTEDESRESFENSANSEQFEELKAASSGAKLIPVGQAPRAQRSSFSLHKQSKLVAAESNTRLYNVQFKQLAVDDQVTRYGDSLHRPSFRNSSSANIPDSVLQTVLPKKGERARKSGLTMLANPTELPVSENRRATLQEKDQSRLLSEDENQQLSLGDSEPSTPSQASPKTSPRINAAPSEEQKIKPLNKPNLTKSESFSAEADGVGSPADHGVSLEGDELHIQDVISTEDQGEAGRDFHQGQSTLKSKSRALNVLNLPSLKTEKGKIVL